MFVKQCRSTWVRVPDPLRPGRRALEERLTPTGAESISHPSGQFTADEEGWFDVPAEVAADLLRFRHPGGERFYTPAELNELAPDRPRTERPRRGRPPKQHTDA